MVTIRLHRQVAAITDYHLQYIFNLEMQTTTTNYHQTYHQK